MPFPATVDLDDIAVGSGGFKIQGESAGDFGRLLGIRGRRRQW